MVRKKVVFLLMALSLTFLCSGCLSKKTEQVTMPEKKSSEKQIQRVAKKPLPEVKKYDLYSSTLYDLPLFSIVEISKLPQSIKDKVDKILEDSQGFYLLRFDGEKVLIILQNPIINSETYKRHDLQFAEISKDGEVTYHNAGYAGIAGEIFEHENADSWILDETVEPHRPLKHTSYNENGKVKFIETWNYDEKDPVKYQMKDSHEKVISLLKEVQENDSNYRREHVFYDNDGNIKMSLTINYDGANVSRLTFYNSHDLIDSITIVGEFENGIKTKELIYNEEYQLVNSVHSDYVDDERKCIRVLDSEGNEINKISS